MFVYTLPGTFKIKASGRGNRLLNGILRQNILTPGAIGVSLLLKGVSNHDSG